jgi:uncharacterized protein
VSALPDGESRRLRHQAQRSDAPFGTWRDLCRSYAAQQAEAEAQAAWRSVDGAQVPFNHRWEHVQEVAGLALRLADLTGADVEIVEAAAWLHDVRKGQPNHGAAGARAAEAFLRTSDFPAVKIPAVVDAIQRHVGLFRADGEDSLTPVETAVLWDADKLSKLGVRAIGLILSTHWLHGKTLAGRREDMADHVRSVLGRTVNSMNTAPGLELARRRYGMMVSFLDEWAREEHEAGL